MNKIRRISYILRMFFIVVFIALPVYTVLYWLTNGHPFGPWFPVKVFSYNGPTLPPIGHLTTQLKVVGFLINLIPIGIYMAVTAFLIRLFKLYEKGKIFTLQNVKFIRYIGILILIAQLFVPIYTFLISYALTSIYPVGYRFAYVGISFSNIIMIITALLIILISWIMEEGHKIHEEQIYTV